MQSLKNDSTTQYFTHTSNNEIMTSNEIIYLKFDHFLLNLIIDSINRRLIVFEKFDTIY